MSLFVQELRPGKTTPAIVGHVSLLWEDFTRTPHFLLLPLCLSVWRTMFRKNCGERMAEWKDFHLKR